jgi:hypothetical protein
MNDNLPRSIPPRPHPTLRRTKFFAVAGPLLPEAVLGATAMSGNQGSLQVLEPSPLAFEAETYMTPFEKEDTFPMPVLKSVEQQGEAAPIIQSEISGLQAVRRLLASELLPVIYSNSVTTL